MFPTQTQTSAGALTTVSHLRSSWLGPARLHRSHQEAAPPPISTATSTVGRADPSLCPLDRILLHGSLASCINQRFPTPIPAASPSAGGQKPCSRHGTPGDRRHLFCQSLRNGGLSSRGKKTRFRAAEFAGISKCQLTEHGCPGVLQADGSSFCIT